MRCDTCGQEVPEVSRVVIYTGYNKIAAKAVYNCPECFARKEQSKPYNQPEGGGTASDSRSHQLPKSPGASTTDGAARDGH